MGKDGYGFLITQGIAACIEDDPDFGLAVIKAVRRFESGDWGNVCEEDAEANDRDKAEGGYALGSYTTGEGDIWVDDSNGVITVMFPYEY